MHCLLEPTLELVRIGLTQLALYIHLDRVRQHRPQSLHRGLQYLLPQPQWNIWWLLVVVALVAAVTTTIVVAEVLVAIEQHQDLQ
jgi:hypothetical protein